ncbi:MAG: tRNA 2-thiouridine(34) synthase MnmA, partial [Chromatocurvus sp.]
TLFRSHGANFAAEYWDNVFEHFLAEYRAGRTPNPDILCNREIKFRAFLDYALMLGADCIATGHYTRRGERDGKATLLKGTDDNKDQSYFLHAVDHNALAHTLFPIGDMPKPQVREIAAAEGLITHDKKDSTGICFIGERRFRDFLQQYLPAQPGPIVSADGDDLGEHQGLMYHTIGQRQGLGIGGRADAGEAPWYVAAKCLERNELIVVQGNDHPALFRQSLSTGRPLWIADSAPELPLACHAKIRYRQADQPCTVTPHGDALSVAFDSPQRAVTPGQSIVFYHGDECLGGAVIETAHE